MAPKGPPRLILSDCPICVAPTIGAFEKVAAGLTPEVRCRHCGGCIRLRWPARLRRNWLQGIALGGGLLLSFLWLTPIPFAVGLAGMVLAPVFLQVIPNTRDPMTAKRLRSDRRRH